LHLVTRVLGQGLFQANVRPESNRQPYDVARDGRFLMITVPPAASTEPIHLLLNWRPPK